MIVCNCGHENKQLKNPRYWKDLDSHIGECESCQTSIHFEYLPNGDIERATLSKERLERIRKNISSAIRNVA
jgi:hypothetical protein